MKIGKKLLSLFLCIIFLCSGLAVNSSAADEFTYGDYSYTVSSDEVTIVSYPEQATGTVNIPSKIDGKEVVAIDDGAFQACTLITEVIIPNTVTTIGKYAFAYCVTLNSVTIPSSVTSIGQDAFQNSKNVTIKCESGSYAEKYAKNEKINFIFIGNIYNLGEETYGFDNYSDEDNAGHCFGMSITSSGYYNKQLSTSIVGLDSCKEVNSLFRTKMVTKPICFYQKRQGKSSTKAIVAGGSSYLGLSVNLKKDWNEVVEYVKNHSFDDKGSLQIGYRGKTWNSKGEIVSAGHAINFLRYENVSGQDRIYAYDNNFPDYETFFYMDSKDVLHQEPSQTFSIEIESICLRDIFKYYSVVGETYDDTHVIYADSGSIDVVGINPYKMDGFTGEKEQVMFEIPETISEITIIPLNKNSNFEYLGKNYNIEKKNEKTIGKLRLVKKESSEKEDPIFKIQENDFETKIIIDHNIILNYKTSTNINPKIDVEAGTEYSVSYTSSNPSVARVDDNGNVYGAKRGSATITCTVTDSNSNTVQDTCTVTVKYSFGQWLIKILLFGWIWY